MYFTVTAEEEEIHWS